MAISKPLVEFEPEPRPPELSGEWRAVATPDVYMYHYSFAYNASLVIGVEIPPHVTLCSRSASALQHVSNQASAYLSVL